jgi:hypothetical protein
MALSEVEGPNFQFKARWFLSRHSPLGFELSVLTVGKLTARSEGGGKQVHNRHPSTLLGMTLSEVEGPKTSSSKPGGS